MNVFVFPISQPKMIPSSWFEELFPEASVSKVIDVLEHSIQGPKTLLLGAFNSKTKQLKGFVWGEGNDLDSSLFINSIYVDKNLRRNPKIVGTLLDYIKDHYVSWGYSKVLFFTKKPNFYLKRGCKVFSETCIELSNHE